MRNSLCLILLFCNLSLGSAGCKQVANASAPQSTEDGTPIKEIKVTLKGFEPARLEVAPDKPVVLRFTRKVNETCADAVDVEGDPVRHMLPLDRPVDVRVTAKASGEIAFACPMKMIRGAVVVLGH